MKYFEFTFHTSPCTETVNDVLTAVLGEVGFESFVECEGGLTAYIQQSVCDENAIKTVIAEFPLSSTTGGSPILRNCLLIHFFSFLPDQS